MRKFLSEAGWSALEYIKKSLAPFVLKLMMGLTMLSCAFISITELKIILIVALFGADCAASFLLLRSSGQEAYKMKVVGQLKRENKPLGLTSADGKYRPCREYRVYKGFVIGVIIALIPLVLLFVGAFYDNSVARAIVMIVSGWAYIPVLLVFQLALGSTGEESVIVPNSSLWWGYILVALFLIIATVAYILGGSKEKLRQYVLARQTESIDTKQAQYSAQNAASAKKGNAAVSAAKGKNDKKGAKKR